MIFDVNMEYFRQKARLVDDGYVAQTPETITNYSVASIETARVALTLLELNDLEVKAVDTLPHLLLKIFELY